MNRFLTLKVLVHLFTLFVSCLAHDIFIPKKKDDSDEDDEDDDDNQEHLAIYIAVGVIGSLILIAILLFCLRRCCLKRRKNGNSPTTKVLAVVPKPRHLSYSISNESYTGPSPVVYPSQSYGTATAPPDHSNSRSYQNPAFDGYNETGQFEAPPPYFEYPPKQEETVSDDIADKLQANNEHK